MLKAKKNGFTLIELLAVIAILAIVLLIAVPTVLNMIEKARTGAFRDNSLGILRASKDYVGYFNIGEEGYNLVFDENGKVQLDISKLDLQANNMTGYVEITKDESGYTYKVNAWNGTYRICSSSNVDLEEVEKTSETCEGYIPPEPEEPVVIEQDTSGASVPNLHSNMIPVKWNGSNWVKADKSNPTTNRWFDYSIYQWANAVTVKETGTKTRNYYLNTASIGEVINESDILTFMVWIPRYRYLLFNANNEAKAEQQIEVIFESKGTAKSTGTTNEQYLTHPAFTFGDDELDGFWVGKFEIGYEGATTAAAAEQNVTTANKIIIKPNVYSWRKVTVSNLYTVLKQMNQSGNIYGYGTSVDTHMMKNSEWGAVAYLSQSRYGKYGNSSYTGVDKEVAINNCSSYITGIAGDTVSAAQSSTTCTTATNKYDGTKGITASTTGTIYGVYDMSGGATEYVMGAMYKSGNTSIETGASEFDQATIDSSGMSKYIDKYEYDGTSYITFSRGHLGDATRETLKTLGTTTGGWYSDSSFFVFGTLPWFIRGGSNNSTTNAGVFYLSCYDGGSFSNYHSGRLSHL